MASHPPQQCCTIGVKHEGQSTGEMKEIDGTSTYFAYPENKSTDHGILIVTDVIGHTFINVQLIADQFAANGYFVVIPDLFHGDPIPLNRPKDFDLGTWRAKHPIERVTPIVESAIKEMKKLGVKKIGAVGYCFGAKYVVRHLRPGEIDAGYVAHPSFVEADEVRAMTGPLSIAAAETDHIFPPEKRRETEDILFKMDVPWQINLFSDVEHGFAVRGDLKNERITWAKEQAFFQAVQWFDRFIKK